MSEDSVRTDYAQLCKEYEFKIEGLNRQNKELKMQVKELSCHIEYREKEIARLEGRIAGLEFAIRCDGVSGAEVGK